MPWKWQYFGATLNLKDYRASDTKNIDSNQYGHLPVDRRSSSMSRQYTGVVADALVLGVRDHLHGDELCAERQDVDVCVHLFIKKHYK